MSSVKFTFTTSSSSSSYTLQSAYSIYSTLHFTRQIIASRSSARIKKESSFRARCRGCGATTAHIISTSILVNYTVIFRTHVECIYVCGAQSEYTYIYNILLRRIAIAHTLVGITPPSFYICTNKLISLKAY